MLASLLLLLVLATALLSTAMPVARAAQETPVPVASEIPGPVPASIAIERTFDPAGLSKEQDTLVTIRLAGQSLSECFGVPGRPVDTVLIYDVSTSAGRINWSQTVTFSLQLLDNLEQPVYEQITAPPNQSRVAIVTSTVGDTGPVPIIEQALTSDFAQLRTAVTSIQVGGDTDIAQAIRLAAQHLQAEATGNAQAIVLMLHDTVPLTAGAQAAASEIGTQIPIYMVANSLRIDELDQITAERASALVPPENFFPDPQPEEIRRLFVQASNGDLNMAARNFHLQDIWEPGNLIDLSGVTGSGGRIEGNKAIWDISQTMRDQTIDLTYRVKLRPAAPDQMQLFSGQAYIDCNGYLHSNLVGGPWAVAPGPTSTPLLIAQGPTATPTATPSPTGPPPTPTPTLAPAPTPTPGISNLALGAAVSCVASWRWILLLLLPLLVLLLWFLVPLLLRRSIGEWWANAKWGCRLCRLALVLYTLLLAFLLGREIFASVCQPAETVYFWRLQGSGSGIYTIDPMSNLPPEPVRAQNSAGCVGCHTISTSSGRIAAVTTTATGFLQITTLDGQIVQTPDIRASYLAWSPDGSQLAFSQNDEDIAILDIDSGSITLAPGASDPGVIETMPAWSPDGQTLAFVRSTRSSSGFNVTNDADIFTVPVAGGDPTPLVGASGDGLNYYPAYSPDGQWLAFTRHTNTASEDTYSASEAEIFLAPAAGGERLRLAANDGPAGERLTNVSNSWATWSRDGRFLAFSSKRNDPHYDIFITQVAADGSTGPAIPLQGAAEPGIFEHTPAWGPPQQVLPLGDRLLALWPWLLPLLPLLLLCWLLCRRLPTESLRGIAVAPSSGREPAPFLDVWAGPKVEWEATPTLVLGLGGTGRWTLTHLKHNLSMASAGRLDGPVRLLCLDSSREEWAGGQNVAVRFAGAQLNDSETLVLGGDLSPVIQQVIAGQEQEMASWFPGQDYSRRLRPVEQDARQSTGQRRPIGRAVAFRDIQQGEQTSRLWRQLTTALQAVARADHAQILIVGSLGGGFGSGVLADVAYLARLAAQRVGLKGATVSALLATEEPFAEAGRTPQMRVNTLAALREINRFLLAQNRPFPMQYRAGSRDDLGDRMLTQSLLDDCFIFDGHRDQHDLCLHPPQVGTFPMMADALQVLIDKGASEPGSVLAQYRDNTRTTIADEQIQRKVGVVSGLGCSTYRLPLADLVRACNVRFARELVQLWLVGRNAAAAQITDTFGATLALDARHDLEHKDQPPVLLAHQVLSGAGDPVSLLVETAQQGWATHNDRRARDLMQTAEKTERERYATETAAAFEKWLMPGLLRLLNGRPETFDVVEARSGKIRYASEFLAEVERLLAEGKRRVQAHRDAVGAGKMVSADLLTACADRCGAVVTRLRQTLTGGEEFLLRPPVAANPDSGGVYRRLVAAETALRQQREEMRTVISRRTFADDDLVNRLYMDFYAHHLEPALERIFWRTRDQGGLELVVRHWEDRVFVSDAAGSQAFLQALQELAEALGQEVWRERLAERLDHDLWRSDRVASESNRLWPHAEAPLTFRTDEAPRAQLQRLLWASAEIRSSEDIARRITVAAPGGGTVREVRATDPYAAGLIAFYDVLPLPSLICFRRTSEEYLRIHGLISGADHRPGETRSEPVQVFSAEVNALAYESRLWELREPPRLFHPLFVAGLHDLERARLFAQAYVSGMVVRGYQDNQYRYGLRFPGDNATYWLPEQPSQFQMVDPLIEALQEFVIGANAQGSGSRFSHIELRQRLAAEIEPVLNDSQDRLRQFLQAQPTDLSDRPAGLGLQDFISFTRLVVRDVLMQENMR